MSQEAGKRLSRRAALGDPALLCCGASLAAVSGRRLRCGEPRQGGTTEAKCYSLEHAGRKRTFRLYAPARRDGPLPLILVLHGGGGSGGNMEWMTQRGFNRIADRDGALIAYPDGVEKGWNDGRTDLRSEAVKQGVDDVGFLRALVQELSAGFPIDPTRVYATGMSNGGLMSYRLACDAADVFAAVAPVAANLSVELAPRCRPSRPVSIAIVNGTEDQIVPWNGGPIKVLWSERGEVLSTGATVARWTELNRCGEMRSAAPVDSVGDDGTSVVLHTGECAQGSAVALYEIVGGGHTWPSGEPYLGTRIVGRVSRELDANEVIWRFLGRHSTPVACSSLAARTSRAFARSPAGRVPTVTVV